MRYLLTIAALLIGNEAFSQSWKDDIYESGKYAATYKDAETGKVTVQSRENIVLINNDDTISITIMKPEGGKLAFVATIDGLDLCMPDKAPVYIEFSNNAVDNFESQTEENCTGNVRFSLGGKWKRKKTIGLMREQLVRKISIGGTDENHYYMLSREDALELRKTVNCVLYLQEPYID
ncbi:MAG: hypothetical protein EOP56_16050 [Sphingobacteriales bacterium]|nr:MAG: hypothetical protein EOP56_16050 [Sphingobacteriales bacterium]